MTTNDKLFFHLMKECGLTLEKNETYEGYTVSFLDRDNERQVIWGGDGIAAACDVFDVYFDDRHCFINGVEKAVGKKLLNNEGELTDEYFEVIQNLADFPKDVQKDLKALKVMSMTFSTDEINQNVNLANVLELQTKERRQQIER